MSDLESPEAFASRQWAWLDREALTKAIRARDAAVRAEAMTWRLLTEDPKTWPNPGQVVLLHTPHGSTDYDVRTWLEEWDYLLHKAQWMPCSLPLPDPPTKEET